MFELILTREAEKNKKKIHPRYRDRIHQSFKIIQENPFYGKQIKKLSGELEGLYRFRIGDIRIVYHIDKKKKVVAIVSIRSRSDIY